MKPIEHFLFSGMHKVKVQTGAYTYSYFPLSIRVIALKDQGHMIMPLPSL